MTDEEARRRKLPNSDVYIYSQLAYKDSKNNSAFVVHLNNEAFLAFKSTVTIKFLKQIEDECALTAAWLREGAKGVPPLSMHKFLQMKYMNLDNLLFGSGFELHFKAELLLKGYLVHEINKKVSPTLHKKQLSSPIHKNKLLAVEGYTYSNENNGINKLQAITPYSIKFSKIFKRDYLAVLNLPNDIKEIANYYREMRNQIHLPGDYPDITLPEKYKEVSWIDDIIAYINSDIVDKTNRLIEQNDLNPANKLPYL